MSETVHDTPAARRLAVTGLVGTAVLAALAAVVMIALVVLAGPAVADDASSGVVSRTQALPGLDTESAAGTWVGPVLGTGAGLLLAGVVLTFVTRRGRQTEA